MKRIKKFLTVIASTMLFAAMTLSVSANPSGSEDLPNRMVMTPTMQLTVRNTPSTDGDVVGYVTPGQELVATSNTDGWFMIIYGDQAMFVYGQYMSYLRDENGTVNDQNALTYGGADVNGNTYYMGQRVTGNVPENSGEDAPVIEAPPAEDEPTYDMDELDIMMKATWDVNVRKQPGGAIVDVLEKGEDIHVVGNLLDKSWYVCEVDGETVYVSDDYLLPDFPQTMKTICPVNVRTAPGTDNAIAGVLNTGDKVKVSGEENGWLKFTYEKTKKVGYVYNMYMAVVK